MGRLNLPHLVINPIGRFEPHTGQKILDLFIVSGWQIVHLDPHSTPPYSHFKEKSGECCHWPICEFSPDSNLNARGLASNRIGLHVNSHEGCLSVPSDDRYIMSPSHKGLGWNDKPCGIGKILR